VALAFGVGAGTAVAGGPNSGGEGPSVTPGGATKVGHEALMPSHIGRQVNLSGSALTPGNFISTNFGNEVTLTVLPAGKIASPLPDAAAAAVTHGNVPGGPGVDNHFEP